MNSWVDFGNYKEALILCSMCQDNPMLLGEVAVSAARKWYAYDLCSCGDYEGAVINFITANTSLLQVFGFNPLFVTSLGYMLTYTY